MSGDIYGCEKCGQDIHTHCDCGLPTWEHSEELQKELEKYKTALELLNEKMDEFGGWLIEKRCPPQVLYEFREHRLEASKRTIEIIGDLQ